MTKLTKKCLNFNRAVQPAFEISSLLHNHTLIPTNLFIYVLSAYHSPSITRSSWWWTRYRCFEYCKRAHPPMKAINYCEPVPFNQSLLSGKIIFIAHKSVELIRVANSLRGVSLQSEYYIELIVKLNFFGRSSHEAMRKKILSSFQCSLR